MRANRPTFLAAFMIAAAIAAPSLADDTAPATTAPAAQPSAPDVVLLNDGSMIRGTISELLAGDRVTIITIMGDARTYVMSQVRYAGPAARPDSTATGTGTAGALSPSARPLVAVQGQEARLRLVSADPEPGLVFHRRVMTAMLGAATAQGYDVICTAPCAVTMPAGSYQLALSRGDGSPSEANDPVAIPPGDSVVEGELQDRSATRALGWVVLVSGVILGSAVPFVVFAEEDCAKGTSTFETDSCPTKPSTAGWVAGGAVVGAGIIGGVLMIRTRDDVTISVRPSAPTTMGLSDGVNELAARRLVPNGLSLAGTF